MLVATEAPVGGCAAFARAQKNETPASISALVVESEGGR